MHEPTRVESVGTAVVERFGRLDGIANCIGSLLLKAAHLTSFEDAKLAMSPITKTSG